MVTATWVEVRCAVCGCEAHQVICSAREIEAHLEYLRWFHRRRLRDPSAEALSDRADFTQDYATDLVACAECGLVFRSPRPTVADIDRAYAQDHYGWKRLGALFSSQVELYRPKARQLARELPPGSRVIEVGSFVGGFLAAGRERGWQMLGVDPGQEVDEFCSDRGLPVYRGTLPDLRPERLPASWKPGTMDCLAIWNAFDQLPEPEPTLAAARQMLRPGGLLALRVPNGECFRAATGWMRRLRTPWDGWLRAALAWNNLLAFPYLYGYSVRSLEWLLSWHRFQLIRVVPDTLCRLSDPQTRGWASWEERVLKAATRGLARVEAMLPGSNLHLAPWIDLYFRAC